MRLRSVVVPVALACAMAVVPSPAQAAAAQCSLVMPTKIVVDSEIEEAPLRLASTCSAWEADRAVWNLRHAGGTVQVAINFEPEDFAAGTTTGVFEYYDDDFKGAWTAHPDIATTAGAAELTQNTPVTLLKYGSRISTQVTRTSTKLTWAATATSWSGSVHGWHPRARVALSLWHLPSGSKTWKYVKAVATSSTGKATVTMASPKAGSYRLATSETPSMWASHSTPIRGRI